MKLNKRQRLALCMGGLLIVGMLLFPPWLDTSNIFHGRRYSFAASPPAWVWSSDFLAWAEEQSGKLMGLIVEEAGGEWALGSKISAIVTLQPTEVFPSGSGGNEPVRT